MSGPIPALRLHEVGIRHEERSAWTPDGVSLTVAPGEVLLLLGPSGSGKSTLALALNGIIPHAVPADVRGRVEADGVDAARSTVPRLSEHVAMVFQDPDAQLVRQTVLDEVCFGPENLRVPVDEVRARARRALTHVGLWHRRHDDPDRLSGGGKQRLAIACALAMEAPLLVLDEPTANLDPVGIAEVYSVLRSLVTAPAGARPAIVLVEHNLDAAVGLVDRVAVLDAAGRLVMEGPSRATLRARAEELHRLGVWLPVATLAALRLRGAGVRLDPLPLTVPELAEALEAEPALPEPVRDAPAGRAGASPASSRGPDGAPEGDVAGGPAGRNEPLVTVRGLSLDRGGRPAVRDVDLEVGCGRFLAIVGTNGAGKTTLAQAIAGVRPPPRGTVRIGDVDPGIADARTLARTVGFVFQNPEHQFLAATVFDELAHGLRVQARGLPRSRRTTEAEIEETVLRMLERFGLTEARDVHPFLLSGGQKRRLSVGTALLTGPRLLVLDEPTFGQDRERAERLLALLQGVRESGTTVVVVTHDLQLVADHADDVAVLADGRLLAHGATRGILTDAPLLQRAGLLLPPLAAATHRLTRHDAWRRVYRVADVPHGAGPG